MKKLATLALAGILSISQVGCSKNPKNFHKQVKVNGEAISFFRDNKTGKNSITITRPDSTRLTYILKLNNDRRLVLSGRQINDTLIQEYDSTHPHYSRDSAECESYMYQLGMHTDTSLILVP